MKKAKTIIIWGVAIATYIGNIIITIIKGATTVNCIAGWSVAVLLTSLIIYLLCSYTE